VNSADDAKPAPEPEESLEDLLKRVRRRLKYILYSYDVPPQDAEDLLQDTILEAFRKWDSIRMKEGWLIGTLRVKCSNYRKRKRAEPVDGMDMPDLEALCPSTPALQENREKAHDVRALLREVDPRHRAALWLRYGLGLGPHEVAGRLGYSPSSIRKLTLRTLARVQEEIGVRMSAAAPPDEDER
jgi:RNA polymerase sigma factor (sigma-70 family)